jgi:hypothetical protein
MLEIRRVEGVVDKEPTKNGASTLGKRWVNESVVLEY